MQSKDFHFDLNTLNLQLRTLIEEKDKAMVGGKSFLEVKVIHMQIKELSRLIENLKQRNDPSLTPSLSEAIDPLKKN